MTKRACLSLMLEDGPGTDDRRWRRRAESTIGPLRRARIVAVVDDPADGTPARFGRMFDPRLTMNLDAATLRSNIVTPTKEPEPEMRAP